MTTTNDRAVRQLRRPAIQASTLVRSDRAHTFAMFVRTIGAWWPAQRASSGHDRVRDVTVEPNVGGRVYETWDDGTTVTWGEISAWDPPAALTMSWTSTPVPTEVELRFAELGPALTRVTVEHRGWDALTDEQLAQDCGLPGGYLGGSYDLGWMQILDRFARRAEQEEAVTDEGLPVVTDETMMRAMQTQVRPYVLVMLKQGPSYGTPGSDTVIWEHGRRNFALRAAGVLSIVCPIADDTEWCGIGIFDASDDDVVRILDGDPAVRAGVLAYEVHPIRSFFGDRLPV